MTVYDTTTGVKIILRNRTTHITGEESNILRTILRNRGYNAIILGSDWEPIFPPPRPRLTVSRPKHIPRRLRRAVSLNGGNTE